MLRLHLHLITLHVLYNEAKNSFFENVELLVIVLSNFLKRLPNYLQSTGERKIETAFPYAGLAFWKVCVEGGG